jgi:hypothetical protein
VFSSASSNTANFSEARQSSGLLAWATQSGMVLQTILPWF